MSYDPATYHPILDQAYKNAVDALFQRLVGNLADSGSYGPPLPGSKYANDAQKQFEEGMKIVLHAHAIASDVFKHLAAEE